MKIENDKYYTPIAVANKCWDKVIELIGKDNIADVIEPSCGNGAFYHYPSMKPNMGIDIAPEIDNREESIITGDYLEMSIEYKKGRLVIGNPPYGSRMLLAQRFFKKSVMIADYIAFILPISQYNNTSSLFEFDLIYSEDLGLQTYTDRKLHCCFNVYARPKDGKLNGRKKETLPFLHIFRQDCKGHENKQFDIRICYWGDGTTGKILTDGEHYAGEYKLLINDDYSRKSELIDFILHFDWKGYLNCIAMKRLKQYHIINVIKEKFML